MFSKKIITALVIFVGGVIALIVSLQWASTRFDALDGGAPGASTDILGVASIFVALVALIVGAFLLIRGIAEVRSDQAENNKAESLGRFSGQ